MNYTGKTKEEYKDTWGTPVGKDCVSLDTTMCRWLGERLVFLSLHTSGRAIGFSEKRWKEELYANGIALVRWAHHYDLSADKQTVLYKGAQGALRWVARNLGRLWD